MVESNNNSQFRILIVDDTPANVEVLSKTLSLVGYSIAVANSGEKALSIVERVKPDLILLDVMMPGLDGFETCTQLKENVNTKDIPVIFITAKIDTDDIQVGFKVGAVDYITKPFYDEEVRARVNTHIQLKYSKDQLVKLNDHKDYVLGMAAHDLRNPLSLIIGYTEILEEELLPGNNADHLNLLTSVLCASKAMKKLIDDLLDVTAINKCALALNVEAGNLSDLVYKAKELAEISAHSKNITIDVQADDDVECAFDSFRIGQVMENLVSNAIKYSPKNSKILLEVNLLDEYASIVVTDEGPGLTEEDLALIFNDFQTLSAKPTGGESSIGLGLAICKRVIDAHGGNISAQNNNSEGATFTFKLPYVA